MRFDAVIARNSAGMSASSEAVEVGGKLLKVMISKVLYTIGNQNQCVYYTQVTAQTPLPPSIPEMGLTISHQSVNR